MRAIVIQQYGGPEVLQIAERPMPTVAVGQVLIRVKAFGINQAEVYFRQGAWGDVAEISGIECVGTIEEDASARWPKGQKVMALVGGMGRSLDGSYAEFTAVPASNVVAIESTLDWADLAAIPESYATAWSCLSGNLQVVAGQTLLIRGGTSALGQAAVNLASQMGVHVVATTRRLERAEGLRAIGAHEVQLESPNLSAAVRKVHGDGVHAVLDLIGNTTVLDSMAMLRRGGHACIAGFLGGGGPISQLEPVFQIPSGRHLSVFASAMVLGSAAFPLDEIPFQVFVDGVENGTLKAKPARVFDFDDIAQAHRLIESGDANGKIVVRV